MAHGAVCVIWADSWCCSQHSWHESPSKPLHYFQEEPTDLQSRWWKWRSAKKRETRRNPGLCSCSFVTQFQALGVAGRQVREGGATSWGGAHIEPMCQQSSYFITYLRAEIGGWVGEMRERVFVCVQGMRDEGERERRIRGGWEREKDDVLLFSPLLIIYTSHCSGMHVCVRFCTQALIFATETKLQWDVTSARRPHSWILLMCVCEQDRDIECVGERWDLVWS